MSTDVALRLLERHRDAEEADQCIQETIQVSPLEGALALATILTAKYNLDISASHGSSLSVEVAPGETILVQVGKYELPDMEDGWIETSREMQNGHYVCKLHAHVKGKYEGQVREIIEEVRKNASKKSPFLGKAFKMAFKDDGGDQIDMPKPEFIHLPKEEIRLVFRRSVQEELQTNLFGLVTHTALARKHRVPLRRRILLTGKYGTGKSMTAALLAQLCIKHGWTFIEVTNPNDLIETLQYARQYEPCIVFVEDVDRMAGINRNDGVNQILNNLDGVGNKSDEVMVVFTTNHPEKINEAMRRPGRIDAVINIKAPDAEAAQEIVKLYANDQLEDGIDLTQVGIELAEEIPATIREAVERAKLHAISGGKETGKLGAENLLYAVRSIKEGRGVFETPLKEEPNPMSRFGTAVGEQLGKELSVVMAHSRNGHTTTPVGP